MSRRHDGAAQIRLRGIALLAALLGTVLVLGGPEAASSMAASAAPHWSIVSESQPTYFQAGGKSDAYVLIARNDGAAPTTPGSPVNVSDTLPAGVTATKITAHAEPANGSGSPSYTLNCSSPPVTGTVTCAYEETLSQGRLLAGVIIVVTIAVSIEEGGLAVIPTNSATVSGGGAPSASTDETTPVCRCSTSMWWAKAAKRTHRRARIHLSSPRPWPSAWPPAKPRQRTTATRNRHSL